MAIEVEAHPYSDTRQLKRSVGQIMRALWPISALALVNILALAEPASHGQLQASWLSLTVASVVLIIGVLPALLRPSTASSILGCFAVTMAVLIALIPEHSLEWIPPPLPTETTIWHTFRAETLRLANAVLLGPLALHLAIARAPRPLIARRIIMAVYGVMVLSLIAVISSGQGLTRMAAQCILGAGLLATIGATVYLLIRASQVIPLPGLRLAPEARLVLSSILLAELPVLLSPPLALAGLTLPIQLLIGAQIILPLGITVAIMRHDLLEIDATVRRALAYGALSLLLLVIYLGLTSALIFVLSLAGQPLRGIAALSSLLIAALAFAPVRRLSSAGIERVLYPERCMFQQGMLAAQASLDRVVRREDVELLLVDELPHHLGAAWAKIDLTPDQKMPAPLHAAWSAPLHVGEHTLGRYWLGGRHANLPYAADEQTQLAALLRQAALALAYSETVDALSTLNRELEERVETRTAQVLAQQRELIALEERQRLARDLHDSVKQTLFSLGLGVRAARGLITTRPEEAQSALREQEQAVMQAQMEMGALLNHLRVAPHGQIDLVRALVDHCAALERHHELSVSIEAPPSLRMPERSARELLRIAREALHNVVKHSGGAAARLHLAQPSGTIVIEVRDDGRGFEQSEAHEGMGLNSMAERAEALGGTLELWSVPGHGTTVRVRIPTPAEEVPYNG